VNPWTVRPGTRRDGAAVDFGVFSRHAEQVYLCLLDEDDTGGLRESRRIAMQRCPQGLWHHREAVCPVGQRYGYRAQGPWNPLQRHCFNPNRLLLDPHALRLAGGLRHGDALRNVAPDHPAFVIDSLPDVPHAVIDTEYAPVADTRPCIPWEDTVIYEAHVQGLTMRHPEVDAADKGRYRGLASPAMVAHFRQLGVTTLQLMPIQYFVDEPFLAANGRRNYWGYNPLAWQVPSDRYALGDAPAEFRETVAILHDHGIEVILDVVFNHTAEAGADGLTLSWRGLDNAIYYQHDPADATRLANVSGCGNAVSLDDEAVVRLVMDALRHWADCYGVDGFRFDLASVLCRRHGEFDERHPMWGAIRQDPRLCDLKWIVEPWDASGYHLGRYAGWVMQLNDQFRDQVRRVIRGDHGQRAPLARRLAGSWDIFVQPGQHVLSGINHVTTHDGFTLCDVVSYSHKHNLANGEGNQDGQDENYSHNAGIEGLDAGDDIQAVRFRRRSNALMLLAFAQGVPLLSHGDEIGHTRRGNNNGWCLEDADAWLDWQNADQAFLAVASRIMQWRRRLAVGRICPATGEGWRTINRCLVFWRPDGQPMTQSDWDDWQHREILMEADAGRWWLLVNPGDAACRFVLPDGRAGQVCIDTAHDRPAPEGCHDSVINEVSVAAGSVVLVVATSSGGGAGGSSPLC
jgi:glycogen debranching enzyme GlgX